MDRDKRLTKTELMLLRHEDKGHTPGGRDDCPLCQCLDEIETLRTALVFYANEELWEDADKDTPGIFRKAISGTSHPASVAQKALSTEA